MQKSQQVRRTIRRRPDERQLADAILALHEKGPSLVCELWDRIEELQGHTSSESAREMAERLVSGLR